jgi:hypothetical protein
VGVKGGINPHISYNLSFLEYLACHHARLDMWVWETGGYPRWFKNKVVAFYNMSKKVEAHTEDAVSREMDKRAQKSKQKGRGY